MCSLPGVAGWRDQGHAKAKVAAQDIVADHARAMGWKRLYWNTDASNATARKLYDSFTPDDGHVRYRMTL